MREWAEQLVAQARAEGLANGEEAASHPTSHTRHDNSPPSARGCALPDGVVRRA